MQRPISLDT